MWKMFVDVDLQRFATALHDESLRQAPLSRTKHFKGFRVLKRFRAWGFEV